MEYNPLNITMIRNDLVIVNFGDLFLKSCIVDVVVFDSDVVGDDIIPLYS